MYHIGMHYKIGVDLAVNRCPHCGDGKSNFCLRMERDIPTDFSIGHCEVYRLGANRLTPLFGCCGLNSQAGKGFTVGIYN